MPARKKNPSRNKLATLLTREALMECAGEVIYNRGVDYSRSGSVRIVEHDAVCVIARVSGELTYDVSIHTAENDLEVFCSCPHFEDGNFCKHLVAAGLVWINQFGPRAPAKVVIKKTAPRSKRVKVDASKTQFQKDKQWADALRERIVESFQQFYQPRHNLETFLADANDILSTLRIALPTRAALVAELADFFILRFTRAGWRADTVALNGVLDGFITVHHAACDASGPIVFPAALGEKIFGWFLDCPAACTENLPQRYEDLLGEIGARAFYAAAERDWENIPVLTRYDAWMQATPRRERLEHLLESRARAANDFDALMSVFSRNQSSESNFLKIATGYSAAGRHDDALRWLTKGMRALGKSGADSLYECAAEELHLLRRDEEAAAMAWNLFKRGPTVNSYLMLKKFAEQAATWTSDRIRAIELLRQSIETPPDPSTRKFFPLNTDGTLLVKIFLAEPAIDDAWNAAVDYDCSAEVWLQLAEARTKKNPEDAVAIYQSLVETYIASRQNAQYSAAVALVKIIQSLMRRMKSNREFADYLTMLRERHSRIRNFVKLLNEEFGEATRDKALRGAPREQ